VTPRSGRSPAVFTIDGAHFDDLEGFYDEIDKELMGGQFWGRNLDAFDDILSGDMGRVPSPDETFTLVWRNSALSQRALGHAETARHLRSGIDDVHPTNRAQWERRAIAAERGEGETLFDTLLDIIRGHENITLRLEP
jgi:RNAse (barnase) inhibitor barstar